MAPTRQGEIKEFLDVERGKLTVQGAVTAGAIVRSGATLTVQGVIAGPLEIEDNAIVTVQGVLSCDDVNNQGTLLLSGVVNGPLPEGAIAIEVGTLLNDDGGTWRVEEDGLLRSMERSTNNDINLTGEHYLVRMRDGTFEPLGDDSATR